MSGFQFLARAQLNQRLQDRRRGGLLAVALGSNVGWLDKGCVLLYRTYLMFGCFNKVFDSLVPDLHRWSFIQLGVIASHRCLQHIFFGSGYVSYACCCSELCALLVQAMAGFLSIQTKRKFLPNFQKFCKNAGYSLFYPLLTIGTGSLGLNSRWCQLSSRVPVQKKMVQ